MSRDTINGQSVEVVVIGLDGKTVDTPLTPRERWTAEAVDQAIRTNAAVQAAYPEAVLQRVDSMRGIQEHRHGRYYLRYHWAKGVAEFWGYLSPKQPAFDLKRRIVGVVATPDTPTSTAT
jgi:hypothetical protein